ncbi:hypothetical protein TNIN_20841 [Trichonephila inaurata madagascariensis]|uniref:Uncharacterized protein n=1 Tax=Trichonephila inaurata madagascariensis TaxID=2747483 RepID=A0A8X6YP72_9ARAC|nr:hypothetical protein TNIN_20841 [Trichonephila inaurata madagascariensis]
MGKRTEKNSENPPPKHSKTKRERIREKAQKQRWTTPEKTKKRENLHPKTWNKGKRKEVKTERLEPGPRDQHSSEKCQEDAEGETEKKPQKGKTNPQKKPPGKRSRENGGQKGTVGDGKPSRGKHGGFRENEKKEEKVGGRFPPR